MRPSPRPACHLELVTPVELQKRYCDYAEEHGCWYDYVRTGELEAVHASIRYFTTTAPTTERNAPAKSTRACESPECVVDGITYARIFFRASSARVVLVCKCRDHSAWYGVAWLTVVANRCTQLTVSLQEEGQDTMWTLLGVKVMVQAREGESVTAPLTDIRQQR